ARAAFMKLGDTRFTLEEFTFHNPAGRFVPVSRLNQLRRDLCDALEGALQRSLRKRCATVGRIFNPSKNSWIEKSSSAGFRWSVKVDRLDFLDAFEAADWDDVD